jgi:RNA polymerase sigma factor (TIGR02999 family)
MFFASPGDGLGRYAAGERYAAGDWRMTLWYWQTIAQGGILLPGLDPATIMMPLMSDITRILSAIEQGDPHAAEQLLPLVYDGLRQLAAQRLAQEKPGQTLQATALVHEAYLRLVDVEQAQRFNSRGHFFAACAEAMRRILVDTARSKQATKRGGGHRRIEVEAEELAARQEDEKLLALHEALSRLEQQVPAKAELVKLRYFAGLSIRQTAEALGISTATADRYWAFARAWLQREMSVDDPASA